MGLGIRWGVGHSTGLVIVAVICIMLKGQFDIRAVSHYLNIFVGAFMILLGLHGIFTAVYARYFETDEKLKGQQTMGSSDSELCQETQGLLHKSTDLDTFGDSSKESHFAQTNVAINDIDIDGLETPSGSARCCKSCTNCGTSRFLVVHMICTYRYVI